jgi:hypothetical protein
MLLLMSLLGCSDKECTEDCGDDSGETGVETDDTGDTGYTGPAGCETAHATFTATSGTVTDLTQVMTDGTYTTLEEDGTLEVCPGTWFTHLVVHANVTVSGLDEGPETTILSGGELGTVIEVSGPYTLTTENVTFNRGAGLDVEHNSGGGGLYCELEGSLVVRDSVFSENFANDGAGLYAQNCTVDVQNTLFHDNVVDDDGGALTVIASTATLYNVTFDNNVGLDGGAMAVFQSEVEIYGTTYSNNTSANFAGALWVHESTATIVDSFFDSNTNSDTQGGALLLNGSVSLNRVEITGNSAPRGGGIFVYWEADVLGTSCLFRDNSPEDIFSADYSQNGGVSHTGTEDYSFFCEDNECAEL